MKLFLRGNVYQVDVTIDGKRYRRSTGVTLDQGEDLAYKKAKELVEKLKDSMTQRQSREPTRFTGVRRRTGRPPFRGLTLSWRY